MAQWICSFCRDVIFVIPVRHAFQSYPHSFVGIDNTSIFGLVFPNTAAGFHRAYSLVFYKASLLASELPTFYERFFHGVFEFFIIWVNEEDSMWLSGIIELWVSRKPIFVFALLFAASDICFHISGHTVVGSWGRLIPRQPPTLTMYIHQVAFRSIEWILWSLSMHQIILFLHPRSSIFNMFLQLYIQWCMCCLGNVDVLQWNRKWFFFRHMTLGSTWWR